MPLKVVSWNINGLSTIVHYHPWNSSPTPFKALLDQFDADIICFQEHKLQRKDITFAIANIPGYDAYFSFSKVKKGYSGVAVYLRHNIICLQAEEGLTGCLKSPSGISFKDLPDEETIGGYPTSLSSSEAIDLDSEGRAVIVELDTFIFISVYCPAVTIAERQVYREKFLSVLEERIRNLIGLGKSVIIAGDINICRAPIDTADPIGAARRTESGVFEDTSSRRWLKRLLRPDGPLVDTGRHFHPDREGMYTCWEQRIQARAGNYGSRIDYVLATEDLLDKLTGADISPNIIGSDHCPVWATLSFSPTSNDPEADAKVNQPPRMCARYFGDVVPSRSIRSLFANVPGHVVLRSTESPQPEAESSTVQTTKKRDVLTSKNPPSPKRQKLSKQSKGSSKDTSSAQRSMSEFFKPPTPNRTDSQTSESSAPSNEIIDTDFAISQAEPVESVTYKDQGTSAANEQWTSIFTKKGPPKCEAHGVPCTELVTKKPGPNLGRRFWICSKPVGPGYDNGKRQRWEINPEFRCNYFKWSSDLK